MSADSSSAESRNVDLENLQAKNHWRLNTEQAPNSLAMSGVVCANNNSQYTQKLTPAPKKSTHLDSRSTFIW